MIDDKRGPLPEPIKTMLSRMDYDVVSQTWYVEYTSNKPGNNTVTKKQQLFMPIEDFNKGKEPKPVSNDLEAWYVVEG
jgi:DNA/RNA endonuclease G (NUC1)